VSECAEQGIQETVEAVEQLAKMSHEMYRESNLRGPLVKYSETNWRDVGMTERRHTDMQRLEMFSILMHAMDPPPYSLCSSLFSSLSSAHTQDPRNSHAQVQHSKMLIPTVHKPLIRLTEHSRQPDLLHIAHPLIEHDLVI
jgi:hypothetical protein